MEFDFDAYALLGVSSQATADEIKVAYRRAARRLHPDVNQSAPGAGVQFQAISQAYEILSDEQSRMQYDVFLKRLTSDPNRLTFSTRATLSKRALVPLHEPQVIYLLTEIQPDPRARAPHESPRKREIRLNLTLVLDHSNSMNGTRMERVKAAAHQIIDQLNSQDVFSVVTFNDRAETIIAAGMVADKSALKARISVVMASGGTEIYQGLSEGVNQNRHYLGPRMVNHVILLTDGNTFGDHEDCISLAHQARKEGITISAMGLGQEWNDQFLDQLASVTGGSSAYINSASAVVQFLNDHVRNLSNAFAERMQVSIAPDPDIQLESAFRILPQPQPLTVEEGYISLGSLQVNRSLSILFQFQLPPDMNIGFRSLARVMVTGEILENQISRYQTITDVSVEISESQQLEEPPIAIMNALGKLTLYRMQERAQEAVEAGNIQEATRRLENLATRLLAMGEPDLANQALAEARRVAHTSAISDKGRKTLKYQTRHLLLSSSSDED